VLGEDGKPLSAVHEIVDLVRQTDAVLATGHISGDDHYMISKEFARGGKVVVTHAGESRSTLLRRPGQASEIARSCLMLAAPGYVTAQVLIVDGGMKFRAPRSSKTVVS
jgi:NAD(P)-dependent dehydrogenase (short-subunit alcohol dehydrogenase family)